jgi:hypothetical protein
MFESLYYRYICHLAGSLNFVQLCAQIAVWCFQLSRLVANTIILVYNWYSTEESSCLGGWVVYETTGFIFGDLFSVSWHGSLHSLVWNGSMFLGTFANLRNATTIYVISVRLSIRPSFCPCGTTWLTLDGFSWNLTFEYFSKICQENSSFITVGQEQGHVTWRKIYIFVHISHDSS